MQLTVTEQIRLVCQRKGMTLQALAKATNQTYANLNRKMRENSYTVNDLEKIAAALGVVLVVELREE